MYARGLTTRQISEQIEEIYGFECSESFISDVTDKVLQDIEDWQNRALDESYPILFIDAVHFSVREDNIIRKLAAYVIIGINCDGMKEAISAAFPKTEYQRCIVHQVRNTLKYVSYKEMKEFAADLKKIYLAPDESKGKAQLDRVTEKWNSKYPNSMKSWYNNWDLLSPNFKLSSEVRKIIYTTNTIESLNSTYKKLNRQRTVFPSNKALLKSLYLSTLQATGKWTQAIRNWGKAYGEFSIMYEGRIPL